MRPTPIASALVLLVVFSACSNGDSNAPSEVLPVTSPSNGGAIGVGGAPMGRGGVPGGGTSGGREPGVAGDTSGGAENGGSGGVTAGAGGDAPNGGSGGLTASGGATASGGSGGVTPSGGSGGGPPLDTAVRAQLLQHCPYGGWSVGLPAGDYTRAALLARGFVDNDLSSLRAAPGYEVVLYDGDNFSGNSVIVGQHSACLTAQSFNDVASSVRVRRKTGSPVQPAPKWPTGAVNTTFYVVSDTHADPPGNDASTKESHLLSTARAINKVATDGKWPTQLSGELTGFDGSLIGAPVGGVAFTGDLIGYSQAPLEYPTFEKYFFSGTTNDSIKYRAFVGFGNHDLDDPPSQNNPSYRTYAHKWLRTHHQGAGARVPVTAFDDGSLSYSWDHGGVHFVHLNRFPGDTNWGLPSNLPFLEQDLAARAADGRPVVLFHHYGFDAFGTEDRWWTAAQRTAYGDRVTDTNVSAMVVGHSHYAHDLFMFNEPSRSDNRVIHVNNAKGENGSGNNDGNGSFVIIRIKQDELWMVTCRWLNTAGDYEFVKPYYRGPAVLLK